MFVMYISHVSVCMPSKGSLICVILTELCCSQIMERYCGQGNGLERGAFLCLRMLFWPKPLWVQAISQTVSMHIVSCSWTTDSEPDSQANTTVSKPASSLESLVKCLIAHRHTHHMRSANSSQARDAYYM